MFLKSRKIKSLLAREILDSRGNPTVEVQMSDGENEVLARVPSGASTGVHEALELRDGDHNRFFGKGVLRAVKNVHEILRPEILGQIPENQQKIDEKMMALDGTSNKSRIGANAILGVSLAAARLAAAQKKVPLFRYLHEIFPSKNKKMRLPRPMMNVINGGAHANSGLAVQEFMIFPKLSGGRKSFSKNLRAGAEIFQSLKRELGKKKFSTAVGDEGGFAPPLANTASALDLILRATEIAKYTPSKDIEIALDCAASEFFDARKKEYFVDGKKFSSTKLTDFYAPLLKKYPISSIEDPHAEDDFDGFGEMTKRFGSKVQIVGDDLLVTNCARLQTAIDQKLANAILIKVNQIGTLSETFDAICLAQNQKFGVIISHRSGETEDTFIADLAVATGAGQIKTGSLSRTDRICKYNRLLQIEEML